MNIVSRLLRYVLSLKRTIEKLSVPREFCFYRPQNKVCEGYVFTPVCQPFCSQGGCLGPGPEGRLGGLAGECRGPHLGEGDPGPHPGGVSRPRGLVSKPALSHTHHSRRPLLWAVCILLECILVFFSFWKKIICTISKCLLYSTLLQILSGLEPP